MSSSDTVTIHDVWKNSEVGLSLEPGARFKKPFKVKNDLNYGCQCSRGAKKNSESKLRGNITLNLPEIWFIAKCGLGRLCNKLI